VLVFAVGAERFGVELRAVEEAIEAPEVQPVPEAPPGLLGVFRLRERLLPLFSPARVLGPKTVTGDVVLVMRSGARRIGLAVDDALDVIPLELEELHDPPPGANDDDVVAGLLWRDRALVTVLDARALVGACTTFAEGVA
jgi:chemotaxis signal transduction protein